MTIDVACWRFAAWNLVVLAFASVGTALVGVDPMLLAMG
jgi:hypothetical protein